MLIMESVFFAIIFSTLGLYYMTSGKRNEIYYLFSTLSGTKLRELIGKYTLLSNKITVNDLKKD
jgi:hypothetical protein